MTAIWQKCLGNNSRSLTKFKRDRFKRLSLSAKSANSSSEGGAKLLSLEEFNAQKT